ncbi:MAG: universal stress protein [Pseudodesulfovibrio sp.]
MFKNVLLDMGSRVDGPLMARVAGFCARAGAELTVLNVFAPPPDPVRAYFTGLARDPERIVLDSHEERMAEALAGLGEAAGRVRREVRWGKDFIEAIRLVREMGCDLLVPASQPSPGTLGSTAMHLLRKCPCPVWVHRGDLWKGAVRLMAAVNVSDASDENRALNRKIVEHAAALKGILGGRLHVVSCWAGFMEGVISGPRFSEQDRSEYLDYERELAEREFEALLASAGAGSVDKGRLLHGYPADTLANYAGEQKMDVVVMGTVARTGIPGLLVGNTAEKIVSALRQSILAVKPDGFVSPVE